MTPWDQRLARVLVRPLAATPVTPNQLTLATILLAWSGAWLLAQGEPAAQGWGAGLFVLAGILDNFDGELARLTGRSSRTGYYLDYAAGALSYAAMFAALGIGLAPGPLGGWALLLGACGSACALLAMPLNLGIDRVSGENDAVGYPGVAGFELEDGIYLLAPITWFGLIAPFFVLAGLGAGLYLLWTAYSLLRLHAGRRDAAVAPEDH